jgi:hypothetical protein
MPTAGQQLSNFYVSSASTALGVLEEDPYFQETLPANWLEIIRKIREKILPKAQRVQFEEKLSSLAEVNEDNEDVKAALPDAIRHLITALNNNPIPKIPNHAESDLALGRTFLPSNMRNPTLADQQRLRPTTTCREDERHEELNRHRPLLRPVH